MGVRSVSFLTDFQMDLTMRTLQSMLPDQDLSPWLMQGSVIANQFGHYRLGLSVNLTKEEGDRMVHQLAGLDRAETPLGSEYWERDGN